MCISSRETHVRPGKKGILCVLEGDGHGGDQGNSAVKSGKMQIDSPVAHVAVPTDDRIGRRLGATIIPSQVNGIMSAMETAVVLLSGYLFSHLLGVAVGRKQ